MQDTFFFYLLPRVHNIYIVKSNYEWEYEKGYFLLGHTLTRSFFPYPYLLTGLVSLSLSLPLGTHAKRRGGGIYSCGGR